ncbi:MAG: FliG C-terminal domain-containing protein [Planctomycetota bacterium]
MRDNDTAWRKIAIVVSSLERGDAEKLLRQFSAADAQRIRDLGGSLDAIDPVEREEAIAEFLAMMPRVTRPIIRSEATYRSATSMRAALDDGRDEEDSEHQADDEAGAVELDDSLARKFADRRLVTAQGVQANEGARTTAVPRDIWGCLAKVDGRRLSRCLKDESPTAIAIVLERLPAELAADTLHTLPHATQLEVVERMAVPSTLDKSWVEEIGQALWERTRKTLDGPSAAAAKSEPLAAILAAAHPRDRARWESVCATKSLTATASEAIRSESAMRSKSVSADGVAVHPKPFRPPNHASPNSVSSPKSPALDTKASTTGIDGLADLLQLDDASLAMLVTHVDPWLFALALAGAQPTVARRWMERLGPIAARDVQRQLTQLGPWRLSDAVEAENRLVRIVRELAVVPETEPMVEEI